MFMDWCKSLSVNNLRNDCIHGVTGRYPPCILAVSPVYPHNMVHACPQNVLFLLVAGRLYPQNVSYPINPVEPVEPVEPFESTKKVVVVGVAISAPGQVCFSDSQGKVKNNESQS